MAIWVPGGVAGGAPSGKVGAIVCSHNRGGAYIRSLVIPTNPQSEHQTLARNRVATLSNVWNNVLTAAHRAAWDTYAANVPVTNRLGQQIYLTGLNWYIACNSLRSQAGGSIVRVDDAPTVFNLAAYDVTATTISEATQVISTSFGTNDDWLDNDGALMIWATRPQNASTNYNRQPFRYAGCVYGNTTTPPTSPQTTTVPFTVEEGQAVWVRYNAFNADARIGPPTIYRIAVAA